MTMAASFDDVADGIGEARPGCANLPALNRLLRLTAARLAAGGCSIPWLCEYVPELPSHEGGLIKDIEADASALGATLIDVEALGTDPLARLCCRYRLSAFEADLLGFALAPALDERFGDAIEQWTRKGRRLNVALALRCLVGSGADRMAVRRHLDESGLWRLGLLGSSDPHDLFERMLSCHPALPSALNAVTSGAVLNGPGATVTIGPARGTDQRESFSASVLEEAEAIARDRRAMNVSVLQIAGNDAERCDTLAAAVASLFSPMQVRVEATTGDFAEHVHTVDIVAAACGGIPCMGGPLLESNVAPAGLPPRPPLAPMLIVCTGHRFELTVRGSDGVRRVEPLRPTLRDRQAAWEKAIAARSELASMAPDAREAIAMAALQDLPAQTIRRVTTRAGLGNAGVDGDHIRAALRREIQPPDSALGASSWPSIGWDEVVLDMRSRALLDDVVRRARLRAQIYEDWQFAGGPEGIVALLHGEAGTGKTLSVQAVAARLGLPLITADLSSIVSKYIGETEKHLSELFDAAESFRAILFFDEADALFSKRTGVTDAHDRYANIETNYLLQRIETFRDGIVFLATNLKQNMDDAFVRRIGVSIHLPRPDPGLQIALWDRFLPRKQRASDLDLSRIVERFDLVGGEIRNAALTAAFLAADSGQPMTQAIVDTAVCQELEKMGRPVPRPSASRIGANAATSR